MNGIDCQATGQRLRLLRKGMGLTQAGLAGQYGCRQSLVSAIEIGKSPPSLEFALWVCRKAGESLDWLLGNGINTPMALHNEEPELLRIYRRASPTIQRAVFDILKDVVDAQNEE